MELKDFLRKLARDFLMIQAGITLTIGIIGCLKQPVTDFHYAGFFVPFVYAFFCLLPTLVMYSTRELSMKQVIVRKVIQFVLIECIVLFISYLVGAFDDLFMGIIIAFVVEIICGMVNFVDYFIAKTSALTMTKKLQKMKEENV